MARLDLALLSAAAAIALAGAAACGGDDGVGSSADSGAGDGSGDAGSPADAMPPPDAYVCTMTMCGDQCVDPSTDPAHCGGCDMACDSPGQICSGALPCSCPPDWVPADLTRAPGAEVTDELFPGLLVGVAPLFEAERVDAVLIGYVEETPTGTDIDLASVTAPAPPLVAAAHDVDVETSAVHTPYLATSGTIRFTEVCAEGVRGTVTDAVFVEVGGITDPTPVEGGCEMTVASIDFAVGPPCDGAAPDAGPLGPL